MVEELGYVNWVALSTVGMDWRPEHNLLVAYLKLITDGKCQAFAGFHYHADGLPSEQEMLRQIQLYDTLGFDGMKMLDGKPGFRKTLGSRLDDPRYDLMYDYAVKTQFPILYHINDPYEFWHYDLMPDWAKNTKSNNRFDVFYGDGTYPKKLEIDEETFGFLRKHPNLNLCIPHFFFISDQHGLCCEMLDRYPNLYFDVTPGWEMFENFGKDVELWRDFFKKYSHKILFGTDTYSDHWQETVACLRRALETDESFVAFEENCVGLNLPDEVLDDLYYKNYYKFVKPNSSKKIDVAGVLVYAQEVLDTLPEGDDKANQIAEINWYVERIKNYL